MFRDMKTLEEFISGAIGNNDVTVDEFLEEVDDVFEREELIDINLSKDLIWRYAVWPPFIDPGESTMINLMERLIDDSMAIQLMELIVKYDPERYIYDKRNKELRVKPKTKVV
jgi:hypothetical protein